MFTKDTFKVAIEPVFHLYREAIRMSEERNKLRKALDNLIDEIAKSLHLYQILDWLEEKLERWLK